MKVLSVNEPWASLIKEKKKVMDVRNWTTPYRGELFIHASGTKIPKKDLRANAAAKLLDPETRLAYGHIICKCNLDDIIFIDNDVLEKYKATENELISGKLVLFSYIWLFSDIEPLEKPIPAKGHLSIWNY